MPITALRPVRVRSLSLCCLMAAAVASPTVLCAQQLEPLPADSFPHETSIQWWHGAAVLGGVSALMLLDGSVRHAVQSHRTAGADRLAETVRHFGQPEVYGTVTAGLLLSGALAHNPRLTQMGTRIAGALAVAAGVSNSVKFVAGRSRPDNPLIDSDADDFGLFSGRASWPSGHTAMAFAFATALGDELHQPVARYGLLAAATAVGWSRINDNRHWLSDVAAGAVLGVTSAKFASGRWRLFGLRAPSFIAGPSGLGVGWQAAF
jgi:membrane-associated phospholipid phosphatase